MTDEPEDIIMLCVNVTPDTRAYYKSLRRAGMERRDVNMIIIGYLVGGGFTQGQLAYKRMADVHPRS